MARNRKSSWTRGEIIALCSMLLSAVAVFKGMSVSIQLDKLKAQMAPLKDKVVDVIKTHAADVDISDKSY